MLITLTTDFGSQDAYVPQMKGQILLLCPKAQMIDLTHDLPPQDIMAGALFISQTVPYFPSDTIHLVIVDPGVGTLRNLIAAEFMTCSANGSVPSRQRLVLPDNGLLSHLLAQHQFLGANYLVDQRYWAAKVSCTFHGRDIMGPVAAHWAGGIERQQFGPSCESPITLDVPPTDLGDLHATGSIVSIDHYGNLITNLPGNWLDLQFAHANKSNCWIEVEISTVAGLRRSLGLLPLAQTYGQVRVGEPLILVGSHGLVEIAVASGNAKEHFAGQLGCELTSNDQVHFRVVAR